MFIPDSFNYLSKGVLDSFTSTYASASTIRLALFICLCGFCIIGYITLWIPFVYMLTNEIWNAQKMLTIIPIGVVIKMKKLQKYLIAFHQQIMSTNKVTENN